MRRGDVSLAAKSIELGLMYIENVVQKRDLFMIETFLVSFAIMYCFLERGEELLQSAEFNQKRLFGQIKEIFWLIKIPEED